MSEELKSLGRYEIKGVLGKGAMGLVYDGHDPNLDRRVAIKTILTRQLEAKEQKEVAMRFEREVMAVARLNHRNIVQVYDFGSESDLAYIVMEFIQGRELESYFKKGERFDMKNLLRLQIELLDALDFAHEAGIIHRDVKPANIMIDAGGHAKLTDFGVARMTDGPTGEATRMGKQIGTPSYMSPEQIQGVPLDRRSDVFSAGIIFYQFLTGKKPFESGSQFGLQAKIVQEHPVWPSALVQVPPEFDRVMARALAKEPDQRYGTAGKFAAALKRLLEGKAPEEPGEAPIAVPGVAAAEANDGSGSEADVEFWNDVKDSTDPDEIELYLEQFSHGKFAAEARKKLAALKAGG
ncbi:MAG TPA: serine/threonine-protein kinase [Burkholderiales bacterium]|jgi:serine/threonine-protein kinase|nr:serine/threonine-protein kinase [Burkholderiales bacterium]